MLENLLKICSPENIFVNEPMKNHTSFKVGGPADYLVMPETAEEMAELMCFAKKESIPFFVMGNGSNLLVADKGIRGIVAKTSRMQELKRNGNEVVSGAGVMLSKLSGFAMNNSLTGLEFASGIPGTVGGAIMMNAGAYDGEMKQVTVKTEYIDSDGKICTVYGDEHKFGYRRSRFTDGNDIILRTSFGLKEGNKAEIEDRMKELNQKRKDKQPLNYPSAGSTFKRPEGYFAAKLLEDAGLRGCRINDAQISKKHAGFLINCGCATAKDILALIKHCQKVVQDKFGVVLETEVKMVGEF